MAELHLSGNERVIGQEVRPYAIAGFALGFPFELPTLQANFNGAMESGGKPDVFFAMGWAHCAVHLTFHDNEIGKLSERCKLLEGALDQLVKYMVTEDTKILPPPVSLTKDHRLKCLVTLKEEGRGNADEQPKKN